MLKILFSPKKAERHPIEMIFIAIFYSSLSIFLGSWIFPEYSSLIIVFLSVSSCAYLVQRAIRIEEIREKDCNSEEFVLKKHSNILILLLSLFIGFAISFAFWTVVLSPEKVHLLFNLQAQIINGIKSLDVTGNAVSFNTLGVILANNLKVLIISLILALFYGAGAVFVIVWNASIAGYVIGSILKNTGDYHLLPIILTKYFLHGIPEMLAYITIIVAGGIISLGILKGHIFKKGRTKRILIDSFILILISIALMIFAGLIEVYISPLI